jgi:hypothetical protein
LLGDHIHIFGNTTDLLTVRPNLEVNPRLR